MDQIERFKRELVLRKYSINTVETYVSCLSVLIKNVGTDLDIEKIKDFLISIRSRNYHKQLVSTIRNYYAFVLDKTIDSRKIPYPRKEFKIHTVLTVDEISRLIKYPKNLKHQAIICLTYSCGLRVSEILNLKVTDINSHESIIHIRNAKGNKDRNVPLDYKVLNVLRDYYKKYKPNEYLFNGHIKNQYSERSINSFIKYWAKLAGIKKNISCHTLRRSYATHLFESGEQLGIIQKILGHNDIKTTKIYVQISNQSIAKVKSPINNIL